MESSLFFCLLSMSSTLHKPVSRRIVLQPGYDATNPPPLEYNGMWIVRSRPSDFSHSSSSGFQQYSGFPQRPQPQPVSNMPSRVRSFASSTVADRSRTEAMAKFPELMGDDLANRATAIGKSSRSKLKWERRMLDPELHAAELARRRIAAAKPEAKEKASARASRRYAKMMADPESHADRLARHRKNARDSASRQRAKMMADPELHAKRLAWRRENGKTPKNREKARLKYQRRRDELKAQNAGGEAGPAKQCRSKRSRKASRTVSSRQRRSKSCRPTVH